MRVNLRNDWLAPNGSLYSPRRNPHTFPDKWEKQLPASATRLDEADPPKQTKEELMKLTAEDLKKIAADNDIKLETADTKAVMIEKILTAK